MELDSLAEQIARDKKEYDLQVLYHEAKGHEAGERWSEAVVSLQKLRALAPNYKDTAQLLANIEKNLAEENRRAKMERLWSGAEADAARDDWANAAHKMQELLTIAPNHLGAKQVLRRAQEEQELAALYNEAQQHLRAQRWQPALTALQRVRNLRGNYKNAEEEITRARQELQKEQQAAQRQAEPRPIVRQPSSIDAETNNSSSVSTKRGLWLGLGIAALLIIIYIATQQREQPPESAQRQIEPATQNVPEDANAPAGMVLIPAGTFIMGSNDYDNEKPPHQVSIAAFYMDKYEVTVAQYQKFLAANPSHDQPTKWNEQLQNANRPVVNVSWNDAVAYCEWLSRQRGKRVRLPTEAEWEYAARGGLNGKKYPWGDDITTSNANFYSSDNTNALQDVGLYSPNNYGLYDMAGNVWEWCSSLYKRYPNNRNDGRENLSTDDARVLRGGSWVNGADYLRCADRGNDEPSHRSLNVGFRCAQDVR